eukprot:669644-Hanusia_phi.AAC.1
MHNITIFLATDPLLFILGRYPFLLLPLLPCSRSISSSCSVTTVPHRTVRTDPVTSSASSSSSSLLLLLLPPAHPTPLDRSKRARGTSRCWAVKTSDVQEEGVRGGRKGGRRRIEVVVVVVEVEEEDRGGVGGGGGGSEWWWWWWRRRIEVVVE